MKNIWIPALIAVLLNAACSSAPVGQPPVSPASPSAGPTATPATPSASPTVTPSPATPTPGGPGTSPSPPSASLPPASLPAQLRLSAPTRFFNAVGTSLSLKPELLDATGKAITPLPTLSWSSSRPRDLAVDQSGRVVALSENGYSEITVSLPGTMLKASLVLSVSGSSSGGGGGGGGGSGGVPMPPVITSLSASSSTVTGVGIPVELSTTADGEASFSWRCLGEGCGDFVAADAASVLWRSPAVPGTYTLEVTANRNGLSARATINITVLTGSASVEVEADPG